MNLYEVLFKELCICGCGVPEEAVAVFQSALEASEARSDAWEREVPDAAAPDIWAFADAPYGFKYIVFCVLDCAGLTEHGCALPGWLTEKGKEFLERCRDGSVLRVLNDDEDE